MQANIEPVDTRTPTWEVSLAGKSVRLAIIRQQPDGGFLLDRVGLTLGGIVLVWYGTLDTVAGAIEATLAGKGQTESIEPRRSATEGRTEGGDAVSRDPVPDIPREQARSSDIRY